MSTQSAAARNLTPAEQKAVDAWTERRKKASPRIKAHGRDGEADLISTDHPDPTTGFALLMEAIGTEQEPFLGGLMVQLMEVGNQGQAINAAGKPTPISCCRWSRASIPGMRWKPCWHLRWRPCTTPP